MSLRKTRQPPPAYIKASRRYQRKLSASFKAIHRKAVVIIVPLIAYLCIFSWAKLDRLLGLSTYKAWMPVDWNARREEVKQAFVSSWDAYEKYAFGMKQMKLVRYFVAYIGSIGQDQFHPISKTGSQMSPNGLGWIIVDSIDTMMIMNLTSRLDTARKWISQHLDYDQDQDVNTFETTIRMLGGLLSAHYLSTKLTDGTSPQDAVYLDKAVGLADRLLGAYNSGSGLPYASIQLDTSAGIRSHDNGGASSTAEATTLQIEMKYLAHLTGNATYWQKAERIMEVVDSNRVQDGLVPIFIEPESGRFTDREIRIGSRGDSYYGKYVQQRWRA